MSYNTHCLVQIKNETPVAIRDISLYHKYSDDSWYHTTWSGDLASGAITPGPWEVGYESGFIRTGSDHWKLEYVLMDGSRWICGDDSVQSMLSSSDEGKTLTFSMRSAHLITWKGDVLDLYYNGEIQYNAWMVLSVQNNFPVAASVKMDHHYSDYSAFSHQFPVVPAGGSIGADQSFIVYFNRGFVRTGSDYWNIKVSLELPPYSNMQADAAKQLVNASSNFDCMTLGPLENSLQYITL